MNLTIVIVETAKPILSSYWQCDGYAAIFIQLHQRHILHINAQSDLFIA